MLYRIIHTARSRSRHFNEGVDTSVLTKIARAIAIIGLLCLSTVSFLQAQTPHWEFDEVTQYGYDKSSPRVAYDRWGNHHIVWATENPRRSGRQLFYVEDAGGGFGAPIQATDTGTVVDRVSSPAAPFVFRLDALGASHLAFGSNVDGHYNLYYTDNTGRDFARSRLLGLLYRYDMAVDSFGTAHVVWIDTTNAVAAIYYWSSKGSAAPRQIASFNCVLPFAACRVGNPEIEVAHNNLVIAFRADSGSVYIASGDPAIGLSSFTRLVHPTFNRDQTVAGTVDLRLRMTVDSNDNVHILAPHYDSTRGHRLLYISNATGVFAWEMLGPAALDTVASEFDIAYNGTDHINAVWTTQRMQRSTDLPKIGFAEFMRGPSGGGWLLSTFLPDMSPLIPSAAGLWKNGEAIAAWGERVAISGVRRVPSDSATTQANLIERTSIAPVIRYLHPDAAAAGMNVVVEAYAPSRQKGSFGPDGFRGDTLLLELVNRADTLRVIIGPSVASWNGRLVSTMLFVRPNAPVGAVPLRIRVNGVVSNVDTFFVVRPQSIGLNGVLVGGGVLGSGGAYGVRSRRGVLVVDSLDLRSGLYSVDTTDCDITTPGNQGYLPVTILSRGAVRIDSTAILSVSGRTDSLLGVYGMAGPGGGGGGTGGEFKGGSGYTGGAGPSRQESVWLMGTSVGSGGTRSGLWYGGGSMSGASGGGTFVDAPGGGGTGHPFGASGLAGRTSIITPTVMNPGSYGGGTAGTKSFRVGDMTSGGGGGGHGTQGGNSGEFREANGGLPVGARQLVPLSGGSGGGGGGFASGGYANGGGGGGALALYAFGPVSIDGTILADGAPGVTASLASNASGGGGGAGGGVILGAQGGITFGSNGRLQALGGRGGAANQGGARPGGDGGAGRIRLDGKWIGTPGQALPRPGYIGPATVMSSVVDSRPGSVVQGTGLPGRTIRLFVRAEGGNWNYTSYRETTVLPDSTWSVTLGAEAAGGKIYTVVMQRVANPSRINYSFEPAWVMSPAGGNIIGRPAIQINRDSVGFGCIRFDAVDSADVVVTNPGYQADLAITRIDIVGPGRTAFRTAPATGLFVAPGSSRTIRIYFQPQGVGTFKASIVVHTNLVPDSLRTIVVEGCGVSGRLAVDPSDIDLGEMCPGECRDTTFLLRNVGDAPLTVRSIGSNPVDLITLVLDPSLPVILAPNEEVTVRGRLCPKNYDPTHGVITIRSTTVDSLQTVVVRAVNAGPDIEIPHDIDFGTVELEKGDSCVLQVVNITNRSTSVGLRIGRIELLSRQFRLLDTVTADTILPPGGRITLHVSFCTDSVGAYNAPIRMLFGGGSCLVDTLVVLKGAATAGRGVVELIEPLTRSLVYPPVLVATETSAKMIMIHNVGSAPTWIDQPVVEGRAGTTPAEISLDPGPVVFPYALIPGDSLTLLVKLRPGRVGPVEGIVRLRDTSGVWGDSVRLFGQGSLPGLRLLLPRVEFGDLYLGDSADQEIYVDNIGDIPLTFTGTTLVDSLHFKLVSISDTLPVELVNGGRVVTLRYRFLPGAEGDFQTTATVRTNDGSGEAVLVGRGVREHLAGGPGVINFGCRAEGVRVDSVDAITIVNSGGYDLVVDTLRVIGSPDFTLGRLDYPFVIRPGGLRRVSVRYLPTLPSANAYVYVESSAPESFAVGLAGERCAPLDPPTLHLVMPETGARSGETILLPVYGNLNRRYDSSFAYELTLTYNEDILLPWSPPKRDTLAAVVSGTISQSATMVEVRPGELVITGRIDSASVGDTLVLLPMRVLLPNRHRSSLVLTKFTTSMKGLRLLADSGSFTALDCDTAGGVILGKRYRLGQNHPNPFNPATIIPYSIAHQERVRLILYDGMGNPIRTLLDEVIPAGEHEFHFDASGFPSGIYFYEIRSGRFQKMMRMILLE